MQSEFGDNLLATPQHDNKDHAITLSQNVMLMAMDDARQAAPASKVAKFAITTQQGLENLPAGVLHSLENPLGLAENAVVAVGFGAAAQVAKELLPDMGIVGKAFAVGLGVYFAKQTAEPIYDSYKNGMNAQTMGELKAAGSQLGDALGGLAVNLPIGIAGYQVGGGLTEGLLKARFAAPPPALADTTNLSDSSRLTGSAADSAALDSDPEKTTLRGRVSLNEKASGIDVSAMDLNADPGKDFYRYANGKWEDSTEIPKDKTSVGNFNKIADHTRAALHEMMESAANDQSAAPGSNTKKIGDFYASGMDEAKIEALGAKPLEGALARIDGIKSTADITDVVAKMQKDGSDAMFGFGSSLDPGDSTQNIATASQGGLTLPRDYYLKDDARSIQVRDSYAQHIEKMFGLLGDDKETAKVNAAQVVNVESNLAKISMSDEDLRDPAKTYNKMPVDQLQKLTPNFDWSTYLKELNVDHVKEVNVMTPDFFKAQSDLLGNLPLSEWKNYLRWQEVSQSSPYLSSDFVNEHFNFFGKVLSGSQELSPRWERVVNNTSGSLGEAVGEKYVQDNFPPEAKTRMLDLVGKLKESMRDSLNHADWMSDETRAAALDKLDKMNVKIGYPDKWKDYSSVEVDRNDYFGNITRARQFAVENDLSKIGQPVDRSAWGMTPQTVNAYYSPSMNEIVFPAAILQPPFFNLAADDATNFGAIGSIIGHEITHGFDDQGSQFDAHGNMRNWWTKADAENFQKRIQAIRDQYDGYQLPDGVQVKGKLVSGEAAADLGGSKISFQALQKVLGDSPRTPDANGFTPEQRFYISFAQAFADKARPESLDLQVASDPHPPDNFRVIGTVGNQAEFAKAFNLKDDAPIMLPPDKRTQLW